MIDASKLRRDAQAIKNNFVIRDGKVLTKEDCSILIPYSYLNHNLASTGERIQILAVYAIVVGDVYAASVSSASVVIEPTESNQIKLFGEDFMEFIFPAGSIVCSTEIVVNGGIVYPINENFYSYGRVPWFMSYDNVGDIFKSHKEYNGLNISPDNVPFELIASRVCRDPEDKFKFYRFTDFKKMPVVVPFNSVLFNATNTTAKLLGNYLNDGFTSALLSPSDRTEKVETLLRS